MRSQDVFGVLGLYCAIIHFLPPVVNDSEEVSVVTPKISKQVWKIITMKNEMDHYKIQIMISCSW